MTNESAALKLSIIITIVGGKAAARSCLQRIYEQAEPYETEIIVPFDSDSREIGELAAEFPRARFHFVENQGLAADPNISARTHRLYDRRRSAGLAQANGKIVAMTEDYALPAGDWCEKIMAAHAENPAAAIGGAIENAADRSLNWALYYADFGRYGRPLPQREVEYVSDVNVSYKKHALLKIREIWSEEYHEPAVHQALLANGETLALEESIVVFEERPPIKFSKALRERVEWGRIFAETRAQSLTLWQRPILAVGTLCLPGLLLFRALRNMRRQKRSWRQITKLLPLLATLMTFWSLGECAGYLLPAPRKNPDFQSQINSAEIS